MSTAKAFSSLALVSTPFIDDVSAKTRSKAIPWEGYQRANLITAEEFALLKRVDHQPRARVESILVTDGQQYALLYLNLLKKLARVDTMQYILVMIGDALTDHEERIPLFARAGESDPDLPFGPLLRAVDTQDEFVQLKAIQILTVLLGADSTPLQPQHLDKFLERLGDFLRSQTASQNSRDVVIQCLEAVLPRAEARRVVWGMPSIMAGILDILESRPSPQMTYQVCFCLWLLSFEVNIAQEINRKYDIIPLLTDIAKEAVKEKVTRVIVATFRNLVSKAPSANLPAMLVAQLLPFVKNLATRKWSDDEIVEDIAFLKDELAKNFESLTTYDEYTSELSSGHLSWTPVHESEMFWKENALRLNDREFEQLKILVELLNDSTDPLVLAVAAHDLGQYVKYCDRGKQVVTDLGAKARVMELMTHDNPDVRYHALISVQRLISQPWVR
ncbi:hypothetical protein BOTBODRAFT_33784 [Botryobasidium botryosum FD-172 SS1]|uniref:V-type proton ATPase subunit H n=1 Tax=Botryobasidium botryosum (strain FD-172 SS1) TaxID=930990 RepID=A0A067MMQ5_BOTB1|nr:hypothetical protein BOTBODRAFT_33784 [Botryobasidium botryosum FD-172 SS1]